MRNRYYAMHSGQKIYIDEFSEDDVNIYDIAHHLAKIQRYNGALPIDVTYSVGEHCINLCNYFLKRRLRGLATAALLHDAAEAYLSDIVSPVKKYLKDYRELEDTVENVIYSKFDVQPVVSGDVVDEADKRIFLNEVQEIMPDKLSIYTQDTDLKPLPDSRVVINYNNHPGTVKSCYLKLAKELGLITTTNEVIYEY